MPSRSPRTNRFRPQLEQLNDRITPAGTIKAQMTSGVLSITSTDSAAPGANDQNIALLGASEGHVSISSQGGETIVGKNSFNHVHKVVVKLGNGNDTVTVVDLRLFKAGAGLTFTGGNGNNALYFDGLNIMIDTLKVTSGTGNFTFGPSQTVQQSFGSIDINCPNAACNILLGGMGVTRTTRVVTGNTQDDHVDIDNAIYQGKFTLLTGGGSDTVKIGQIAFMDQRDVTFNSTVVIDMGAGDDSLSAGMPWHGDPDPKPDFVHFNGNVSFNGGDGMDTIDIWHPRTTEFNLEGNPVCDNWEVIVYAP
ncbi:MAG TPA: hypothetical protein VHR66_14350 [Gemmataceae bacterium]|nr:hypothetical protein [Gemmataceae bacterium]